jgi:MraZ protein
MLNTGWGPLKLDQRFRLGLPPVARSGLPNVAELYVGVVPGVTESCLWMLTEPQYAGLHARFAALGDTEEGRLIKSVTVGNFTSVEMDNQGRVYLPPRLVEQVGIKEQVMLVGLTDRLEIWSNEALEMLLKNRKEQIRRGLEALFAQEAAAKRSNAFGPAEMGSGEGSPSG